MATYEDVYPDGFRLWEGHLIPAVLPLDGLEAWLRARGLADEVGFYPGPDLPDDAGAMLVVTVLPGAGWQLEGATEIPSIQVRTIGPQADPAAARVLADQVDSHLVYATYPQEWGTRRIITVGRTGGGPAPDRVDSAERSHYTCTYLVEVAIPPMEHHLIEHPDNEGTL